jgi:hypothetical protein
MDYNKRSGSIELLMVSTIIEYVFYLLMFCDIIIWLVYK